jgi:hypothetical protein
MGPEGQIEFLYSAYITLPNTDPLRRRISDEIRRLRIQVELGATPDEERAGAEEYLDLLVALKKVV